MVIQIKSAMSYYFIAYIRLDDPKEYEKYLAGTDHVLRKYKGEYLAVDNDPLVLEGQWEYTRAVMIRFENKACFNEWYYSADYQNILKHRLKAAHCGTILIKGLEN
jgi:uncharacterized protein (DUF1330 family)